MIEKLPPEIGITTEAVSPDIVHLSEIVAIKNKLNELIERSNRMEKFLEKRLDYAEFTLTEALDDA